MNRHMTTDKQIWTYINRDIDTKMDTDTDMDTRRDTWVQAWTRADMDTYKA